MIVGEDAAVRMTRMDFVDRNAPGNHDAIKIDPITLEISGGG